MSQKQDHELILRAIIALKAVKALLLFALGGAALVFHSDLHAKTEKFVTALGINAGRPTLRKLLHMSDHSVWIAIGSILYACVFSVEGLGLHRRKKWAEWFTVGVTASLIPFEIYELVQETTAVKVIALIINLAIVIYLVIRRLHDR